MSGLLWVVVREDVPRDDDNPVDGVLSAFPIEPAAGDVITMHSPEAELEGRFRVRRRELVGGTVGKPTLVVECAETNPPL